MTDITDVIGTVTSPWGSRYSGSQGEGLIILFNNLLKLVIAIAGIFAFINIIVAGYAFMSAGGNPEKVADAWSRIWQSLLGLIIVGASFLIAAVFGYLVFGDARAIISPTIYGPG